MTDDAKYIVKIAISTVDEFDHEYWINLVSTSRHPRLISVYGLETVRTDLQYREWLGGNQGSHLSPNRIVKFDLGDLFDG